MNAVRRHDNRILVVVVLIIAALLIFAALFWWLEESKPDPARHHGTPSPVPSLIQGTVRPGPIVPEDE